MGFRDNVPVNAGKWSLGCKNTLEPVFLFSEIQTFCHLADILNTKEFWEMECCQVKLTLMKVNSSCLHFSVEHENVLTFYISIIEFSNKQ